MTREEALNILHNASVYHPGYLDALNMAIKALEQEPCTDAISRQAVLNLAKFDGRDGLGSIIHAFDVEQLPSVTPAEKVGRWIDHQEDRWIYAKCSECETVHDARTNYCPNCGSRMMQEVEHDD